MWTSAELKLRAKGAFYKNYWYCVLVALVMSIFGMIGPDLIYEWIQDRESIVYVDRMFGIVGDFFFSPLYEFLGFRLAVLVLGILFLGVKVFLGNPLEVGGCRFFVKNQTMNPTAAELGYGLQSQGYSNVVMIMFLRNLYISLWSLLLVVPGIIKHYEYLMIPYILAENPEMDRREAFLISKRMMMGEKIYAFGLDLSFIGWLILCGLTMNIVGIFFVQPYIQATRAELYTVNRTKAYQEGYIR